MDILNKISLFSVPVIILFIVCYGFFKKVKVYEAFTEGASDAIKTVVKIIPHLTGMLVAIGIFRESGAMKYLCIMFEPLTEKINMPPDVLPMAFMRPLSGGGAMGIMNSIFQKFGPDSIEGIMSSIMAGSTDTTLYVLAVYFGAVNIKNTRHALPAGLIADFAGILAAVFITNAFFKF